MKILLSISAIFLLFVSTFAQSETLRGKVFDTNNAVVPNATVKIQNVLTKQTKKTQTNDEGVYVFENISNGRFTISAEKAGFTTAKSDTFEVPLTNANA